MKQEIINKLTDILMAEIHKFLVENESEIDGSGLEIFGSLLNVLCNLVANSEYDPKPFVDFINETFEKNVLEARKDYQL